MMMKILSFFTQKENELVIILEGQTKCSGWEGGKNSHQEEL